MSLFPLSRPARLAGLVAALMLPSASLAADPGWATLREVFADDFLVGVALNTGMVTGRDRRAGELAGREFGALTAENDMKWQSVHPRPGRYEFGRADAYIDFARKHDMKVIGHTLVWHSQTPRWVFEGDDGKPATRDELLARMKDHIERVAGRYRGRIHGWDVVNEAISDGPGGLRDSPWRRIIGDDFIDHAFRHAREADPQAELYYNDYSLVNRGKRKRTIAMLKGLIERGVPIDGVGMQGHYSLTHPEIGELDRAIREFSALGLKVMITELDVSVLPSKGSEGVADISRREEAEDRLNPYPDGLPEEVQQKLADRYVEIFKVILDHREEVTRVTFWGLHDGQTWLNNFPIRGRTNYPLLFDRELEPKPAYSALIELGQRP